MNGKREMIKELTNAAVSILSKYENDERNGLLSRDEAQKTAISRIQYLRYGEENKDYFWITDMYPVMIVHPYRPDLNGKDLNDFSDPHGKKLFVEFVKTVEQSDHGYVDYMWQWKDDSTHIVPKLSYVSIFKPWNWVIGTGVYIEDVKKEIKALTQRLLWISTGISGLIALMLFFITQQSLASEKKRIEAENELFESKEKYKTLVEAATEGLIMIIDGKISFSNSVISRLIEYDQSELINIDLKQIISDNNNKGLIELFFQEVIKEGQYEINLKKKNGGFISVLITSSTAKFYQKDVTILIVKDISFDKDAALPALDYQKLLSVIDIGFFRARIDTKGKFLYANETAIRILGYDNFSELADTYILKMLVSIEDRKNLRKILLKEGFIKTKILEINKKNNEPAVVAVTLVAINNDNPDDLICEGIIEDITLLEKEKNETNNLITQLKATSFLMEQSVREFLTPVFSIDSEKTITDAIKTMAIRKVDCLLVTKNEKATIGIITNTDIQKRVLAMKLSLDNPVYLIMSSPVIGVDINTSVFDAVKTCTEKNINHLVIKNETDDIEGLLNMADINLLLKQSLSFLITEINKAHTVDELKQAYKKLQLFIKPVIGSDISVRYIINITSSFSDAIIKRLIEITTDEIGKPPVDFTFICMGSEGRKEETLYTDQDNAIIYENVAAENAQSVNTYFNKLGEKVCNALNDIGYSFCKGNIMAKNPQWCQPISVWENQFARWITTPEPQNLLDATIFFDFREVYGNEELTLRLKNHIGNLVNINPLFIYHLAYNTYYTKPEQVSSGKNAETIDLKNAVNFIIMFIRAYAFKNNILTTNTLDRLSSIKAKQLINSNTATEIEYAYNLLMKLRFKIQADCIDTKSPLTNTLKTKDLLEIELSVLKKVLSLIPVYQNKIGMDFRIAT